MCGGTDRYRYDNKRNDGDWFCNNCGVGDGFRLLQETLDITFAEAAGRIDKIVNRFEEEPFKPEVDVDQRRRKLNEVWGAAQNGEVAQRYLMKRGLPLEVIEKIQDVRGHKELCLMDGKNVIGVFPAMLALIRNAQGIPVSIHRTYIMGDGKKQKKIMPPLETITGGYIRLGEPSDTLVLAEGIESALAGQAITGHPAWAAISAHNLEVFRGVPSQVKRVIICADNDDSFVGQAVAFKCAANLRNRHNIETTVLMPKTQGFDMLDVYGYLKVGGYLINGGGSRLLREGSNLELLRWGP
jgi:putative DNA primase/helicase